MVLRIPYCFACQHYFYSDGRDKPTYCEAYPEGIPRHWVKLDVIHDTVQVDQVGTFVFKSIRDE